MPVASLREFFFNFCPLILFSHIRTLDLVIICYMKALGAMKHEQLTETLIGGGS